MCIKDIASLEKCENSILSVEKSLNALAEMAKTPWDKMFLKRLPKQYEIVSIEQEPAEQIKGDLQIRNGIIKIEYKSICGKYLFTKELLPTDLNYN